MTTFAEARDEIYGLFQTALLASAWSSVRVIYPNVEADPLDSTPDITSQQPDPWIRASVTHYSGRQTTIGGPLQRFERRGAFRAEIYVARSRGMSQADLIAKVVSDAFEGQNTSSGIWFRNVRMDEIGPDGIWFRVDVIADFRYDEIK